MALVKGDTATDEVRSERAECGSFIASTGGWVEVMPYTSNCSIITRLIYQKLGFPVGG